MKKKIIIMISILLLITIIGFLYYKFTMYSGTYTIKLKLIDEKSPDREVVVYRNNKETSNYKYIKYKEKDIILCYQKNAVINQFDVEGIEELIVVLPNKSEVISKILKEEK